MSTLYWQGTAAAVAQVANATFATYDATTTRKITINGVVVSALDTGGNLTAALTAFAVVLNASTNLYFSTITWTSNATQIIGTAKTAGIPFTFSGSASGGTGTCSNAYTVATASAAPNDWSTATNWSTGAVPVTGDTVILKDNSISIAWGLAQSGVTLAKLRIDKTYTGRIGLARDFAQAIDGSSTTNTYTEYRTQYLQISATIVEIGQNFSATAASGSGRIKIDLGANASTCTIFDCASSPSDTGQNAVQLLANHASTDIFVRSAPGGLAIANGPGETSTIRKVSISDTSTTSQVFCGPGTTLTTWFQDGGVNVISPAATVTTITVNGGTLTTEGSSAVTTANINGGTLESNSTGTITTLNVNGTSATVDLQQSNATRTVSTLNLTKGIVKADGSIITFTAIAGAAGRYSLTAA